MQQIKPWVWQTIEESETRCKALTTSTDEQHIATIEAHIDAFEERVQKRLVEARLADLSTFSEKLRKFKANLTTSLATPITAPEPTPIYDPLFYLFDSEDPLSCAPKKRPIKDDDAAEQQVR